MDHVMKPQDMQGAAPDSGERREKKELLRSKVQALVTSYEEEKRRNEELEQELERLRGAQYAGSYGRPEPAMPTPAPQMATPNYPPQQQQQQPQGLSSGGYTLQHFAPQPAAPQLTPQNIMSQAQPQYGGHYARPESPAPAPAPQQSAYAPYPQAAPQSAAPSYSAEPFAARSPYAPQTEDRYNYPSKPAAPACYTAADYNTTPRYAEPKPAVPRYAETKPVDPRYAEPKYPEPRYGEQRPADPRYAEPRPVGGENTDALLFTMNRVIRRIEQVRARLHNGYGYSQPQPNDPATADLLDQLYDDLGDLNRELSHLRVSLR